MTKTIKGKFSVKSQALDADELTQTLSAMRMRFDKQFEGALNATSVVSMMGIMNRELGSGGYVAIEKVTGEIEGKKGSFLLQHSSIMDRGAPSQTIRVIPDSGTDALLGISGHMTIDIIEGQHFYTFEYTLS
jgi:hypothetical protein